MELATTRLCHHVNVGPGAAPVPGVVQRGLHLEFLNGIRIGNGNSSLLEEIPCPPAAEIVCVGTIHLKIIADVAGSVDVHVLRSLAQFGGVVDIGNHSGGHGQSLRIVARRERHLRQGAVFHHRSQRRALGLHELGAGGHLHCLRLLA